MESRRHFLGKLAMGGSALAQFAAAPVRAMEQERTVHENREDWWTILSRIAEPVMASLAANQLRARMPVEAAPGHEASRRAVTHLEALGRTVAGIAPWLSVTSAAGAEEEQRSRLAEMARHALGNAADPKAADYLDFTAGAQNLADAAFVALGLSRARAELWERLDSITQKRLVEALQSTRKFQPGRNNWLLFSAMIEAFLASVGAEWRPGPISTAIQSHEEWYKGDGAYGDGADFHWDYYNSYVIQPLLITVLDLMGSIDARWNGVHDSILKRARRFAAIQERLIAPDGSYPPLGRSITYRCGAFHLLAMMALRRTLPEYVAPAQVRGALTAVIHRTVDAPGTFDDSGWLRIGLAGHQPALGESYISTGSLYLCTFAFLPLGLSPADEFWSSPRAEWTGRKIWSGVDLPADHAI